MMGRFKSLRQAQKFLAAPDQTNTIFRPGSHQISTRSYRHARVDACDLWERYACEMTPKKLWNSLKSAKAKQLGNALRRSPTAGNAFSVVYRGL
jgi:hypothetical protein